MEATSSAWNKQNIQVTGFFKFFGMADGVGLDAEMLKQAVEKADRGTPWVSTGVGTKNWFHIGERPSKETLVVKMTTLYTVLPRQLYAFHKHLAAMADLLVARGVPNIGLIHFWMNMDSVQTAVWPSAGEEAYKKIQGRLFNEYFNPQQLQQ